MSSDLVRSAVRWTDAVFWRIVRRRRPGGGSSPCCRGRGSGRRSWPPRCGCSRRSRRPAPASDSRCARAERSDATPSSCPGRALTDEVVDFCADAFAAGGAILSGPGGNRFVYDLRRRFDLFCKLSPLRPLQPLREAGRLRASAVAAADVLIVRENSGGVYQGEWRETAGRGGTRLRALVPLHGGPGAASPRGGGATGGGAKRKALRGRQGRGHPDRDRALARRRPRDRGSRGRRGRRSSTWTSPGTASSRSRGPST